MPDLESVFATAYALRLTILAVTLVVAVVLAIAAIRGRWDRVLARHPRASAGAALLLVVAVLPAAWYLGSPLFMSTEVVEPEPAAVGGPIVTSGPIGTVAPGGSVGAPAAGSSSVPGASPGAETGAPNVRPATEVRGKFMGTDDFHFGRGTARLIIPAEGSAILRFEKLEVRNGPDLFVYLSPNKSRYVKGAIELGRLKADRGSFNYEIPLGTDLSKIKSAVIWCKQFSFQFAVAPLS